MIDGAGTLRILWEDLPAAVQALIITSCIVRVHRPMAGALPPARAVAQPGQLARAARAGVPCRARRSCPPSARCSPRAVIVLLIPVVLIAPFMRYFKLSLLEGATRG